MTLTGVKKRRVISGRADDLSRSNIRVAKQFWRGLLSVNQLSTLKALSEKFELSVSLGELRLLDGTWYVTHAGLLRLAEQRRCAGIDVRAVYKMCDSASGRWVFKATVYKTPRGRGFVGYGDADPSNVSDLVRGAELRMAETRAVNRALRKAYSVGICSIEEIDRVAPASPIPPKTVRVSSTRPVAAQAVPTGGNGQPVLRERLRQLMSQYRLDPLLVKRYATNFCGTEDLRQAPQEKLEAFVNHLAEWCVSDRAGLRCKLSSYLLREEVKP